MNHKHVIYQLIVRLFGNKNTECKPHGSLQKNGSGKFSDINDTALRSIREMGVTHIWYTGVIEQATLSDFQTYGIQPNSPEVVKGIAGSPYAIRDYYDVSTELADDVLLRMTEFQALIGRTQAHGMKVLMDFVPNHVAREYRSDAKPSHIPDLGADDDNEKPFDPQNNFYYLPGQIFVAPYEHKPYGEEHPFIERYYVEVPAKVTGNDVFHPAPSYQDWFETIKLNYGVDYVGGGKKYFDPVPDTWKKMYEILLFWAYKGVDGFRCDMIHMVPLEFWEWVIPKVKAKYPSIIFIGEVYDPALYHPLIQTGGFDYLYDKVGVYDCVRKLVRGEETTQQMKHALRQSEGLEQHMLRFLENHDEQRLASPHFAGNPWAAIPGMVASCLLGPGPVMVYFGQEVGEPASGASGFSGDDGRTTIFDYWNVPEHQKWMNNGLFDGGQLSEEQKNLRSFYQKILHFSKDNRCIREGWFYELPPMPSDDTLVQHKIYAFLRYTAEQQFLIMINFDPENTIWSPVFIPGHAWECMKMDPFRHYVLSDVMGSELSFTLTSDRFVEMAPWSAYVFEFHLQE